MQRYDTFYIAHSSREEHLVSFFWGGVPTPVQLVSRVNFHSAFFVRNGAIYCGWLVPPEYDLKTATRVWPYTKFQTRILARCHIYIYIYICIYIYIRTYIYDFGNLDTICTSFFGMVPCIPSNVAKCLQHCFLNALYSCHNSCFERSRGQNVCQNPLQGCCSSRVFRHACMHVCMYVCM